MVKNITNFIVEELSMQRGATIAATDNLIQNHIVNSMGFIRLIRFIEDNYHITVPLEDLNPENFESVEKIITYINHKKEK